jgi:large subunit ribosomal protein L9
MEVILKQDIINLGSKDDIVKVRNGYANNYLIPNGYAIVANDSTRKMHAELTKQRAHKESKLREEAQQLAEKLKEVKISIGAKTSSKGKIFGSVNTIQIAEALVAKGFSIDRKQILIKEELIKEIGSYTAKVKLYKDVNVELAFDVISE